MYFLKGIIVDIMVDIIVDTNNYIRTSFNYISTTFSQERTKYKLRQQ